MNLYQKIRIFVTILQFLDAERAFAPFRIDLQPHKNAKSSQQNV